MPELENCHGQTQCYRNHTPPPPPLRLSLVLLHHTSLPFNNTLYPPVMLLEFIDII